MDTFPIEPADGWMGAQPETPTFLRIAPAPLVVGVVGLADMLGLKPTTVETLRSRDPSRLPPSYCPPGSRAARYVVSEVIEWLRLHPEQRSPRPVKKRRPGRPTKAEQAARSAQEVAT